MVIGFESFSEWFRGYEDQYVIIGGTACNLLMSDEGLDFRATKDIDVVLIVEAITPEFGRRFWEYIIQAEYEYQNKGSGMPQFFRFSNPKNSEYPFMIELFTRRIDAIHLPLDAVLTPLPVDEDISSLSAILLDDDYYDLLREGRTESNRITVLDVEYLILFKAKAWLDMSVRKSVGGSVDSKSIRKHRNDVFRLSALLGENTKIAVTSQVARDMQVFIEDMKNEIIDTKQLGLARTKDDILAIFKEVYML
ncbi:MAG: nucleotidyl transferase AbiEii/AbiGii toxin family protein [Suipraeoptans sp.]